MNTENGYYYLNLANEWPTFLLTSTLEIAPDGAIKLKRLADGTFESRGVFRGGPFAADDAPTLWYRLQAFADALPGGAHLQLFTFTGESNAPYDPAAENPFASSAWIAAPIDLTDLIIANSPARQLWVGGVLRGDGSASPALHQMRVDYGRDTYLKYLPGIYRKQPASREFLERLLSLHESVLGSVEHEIDDLARLFDAGAAPAGDFPSWLNWLAGWFDFDLSERWPEGEAREHLAEAFQLYGRRGTVEGMRRYLDLYAGVKAHIEEPAQSATMWSLGETSALGFTTRLAPGHLEGAVIGATATLGGSRLSTAEHFGAALFEDIAHRFCVNVYCAELQYPGALADLQAVVEREKPAHTVAHVHVIEPSMQIGIQARVGIDAIIANGPPAAQIGIRLDAGALAAQSMPCEPANRKTARGIQSRLEEGN
jgi:phage tail-like protein